MDRVKCNICDQVIPSSAVSEHVAGRDHAIRKKVAEFNEMNMQVKPPYQQEMSTVRAWIRDLHNYDFLSSGRT
jgi:hypothetical protein